jgi:Ni2+-binding GTPase involved in maturation of urease and hydrogenase
MSEVTITVSGPVGSGKSALVGEIEILMRALCVPVRYADTLKESYEKHVRGADWQSDLDLYQPSVVLVEAISRPAEEGGKS